MRQKDTLRKKLEPQLKILNSKNSPRVLAAALRELLDQIELD